MTSFKSIRCLNFTKFNIEKSRIELWKIQKFFLIPGLLPAKFPNFHRERESKKGPILTGNGIITGSRSSANSDSDNSRFK